MMKIMGTLSVDGIDMRNMQELHFISGREKWCSV